MFLMCLILPQSALSTQSINVGIGELLDSDQGKLAQRFKEIVEELSEGEINVQLFPGGTLGTEQEMVQNVRSGVLDVAIVSTGTLASFVPHFAALHYPYLIGSKDDAIRVTTGYLGSYWNDIGKSRGGFEILGWAHSGFRYLTNSRRPVCTLEDIKGLKIRVPQNRITLATFTAWGAKPVPMAWEETYTSLQQGVIDGQEAPYLPFLEVQKFITQAHYQYKLSPMVIGTGTLAKLGEATRNILTRAGLEAQQYHQVHKIHEAENALQRARDMGIEICSLEDEDTWKEIAREKVWPQFYDSVGGKLVIDTILLNIGKL
ncbi:MAG: TRAP transporter substrate-binding protein [Desulfovibrionales bacterium]|nr:MAG: TRAP transporter substrate-binding protein [Desulfovibrionales bacterium]